MIKILLKKSLLVENAKHELEKVDSEAKGKKKQIIIELAKSMEGKVREEDISKEIIHHLHDQPIPDIFIRECFPEKYKQKYRVKIAKKQKKQRKEHKVIDKLEVLPSLNQEVKEIEDKDEKKKVMLVNVDGSTSIQNGEDSESYVSGNPIETSAYPQQYSKKSFQKKKNDEEIKEYSDYKEPLSENLELKEDEKPSQMIVSENKDSDDDNNMVSKSDNVNFEFSIPFGKIHDRLIPLKSKLLETAPIWFHGIVNKKTGKVVHSDFGRIGEINDER